MSLQKMLRAVALAATASSVAATLSPITLNGKDFVDSSGQRFAILGVDYQPGGSSAAGTNNGDPLSNADVCLRDAVILQKLGVNTIRSYNVDPTLDHDLCMSIFQQAGIYVILDVNSPQAGQSLDRSDPSGSYTADDYLKHVFSVIEAFKNFNNLLGFFGGNEIINDVPTSKGNPPYIRAIQRDMKSYIAKHASRSIPVGYSAADVRDVLQDTWAYVQCDNNDNSRADFFGLNSYSWCGNSDFQTAGYDKLVTMFASTSIPVFFSEYGCNKVEPRVFTEVQALYSQAMNVFNGGLVYEYSQEDNDYGLVNINSNGSVNLLGDFYNLLGQYNKVDLKVVETANHTAEAIKSPKCDASLITSSDFDKSFVIPAVPSGAQSLIDNGVSNANVGKVVPVVTTTVSQPVFNTAGAQVQNLVLKSADGSNVPSGASFDDAKSGGSSSGTSSSSGSAASPSHSKGAAVPAAHFGSGSLLAGVLGLFAVVFGA